MKKIMVAATLVASLGFLPVGAQENKDMPIKGPMPMNEGMPMRDETHCGMDMEKMAEMHKRMAGMDMGKMAEMHMAGMDMGKMAEMHKRMGGMMEMMKMMGDMSASKKDVGTHETKETK